MRRARFLFLMTEGLDETVIDSQVVDSLVAVGREGVRFDLLALTPPRTWLARRAYYRQRARAVAERIGGRVRVVPHSEKSGGAPAAAGLLLFELLRSRADRLVVHARTDRAAAYASLAARLSRRIRYVFDSRGDGEAEFLLDARERKLPPREVEAELLRLRRRRARAVERASRVLCVSTVLRDRIAAAHALDPARIGVVPCVADAEKFRLDPADREATRRELGLADRFVLVYPGRFGRWHYGRETCAVVRGILDSDPSAFFLVLTPDLEDARSLAAELLPEGRYQIRSALHAEVPRFLRAADLALLLRAPDPLNEVACPTKFAEYVMSGLPVLISPGIGDCSAFVAEHAAGAVLEAPEPPLAAAIVGRLRAEPQGPRRERIAAAGAALSRQRYAGELASLYRRLAEE
jgi:glycosyltransferase involved in cell wall biosynthesis